MDTLLRSKTENKARSGLNNSIPCGQEDGLPISAVIGCRRIDTHASPDQLG